MQMHTYAVGTVDEFREGADGVPHKVVEAGGVRLGVYKVGPDFYAYENVCAHEGGPACEGKTPGHTEYEKVGPQRQVRHYLSKQKHNISCPWHGVEYDIRTGICHADPRMRLRSFKVVVRGDAVFVRL